MLRLSTVVAAIQLAEAVGQRERGHFDHDSKRAIGPDSRRADRESGVCVELSTESQVPAYTREVDPSTGEPLFVPRRRK
jgi:hypothetical protein